MFLSKEELAQIKCLNNNVIVIPDREVNDMIKFKNGKELYIDITFEPERHQSITGVVYRLPGKLKYGLTMNDVPWMTEVELSEGEHIWFSWDAVMRAKSKYEDKIIICDDRIYVMINYKDIYLSKDGDNVKMINGFILVEPVTDDELKSRSIIIPKYIGERPSSKKGIVAYIGSKNQCYKEGDKDIDFDSHTDCIKFDGKPVIYNRSVRVGDLIYFEPHADIPLEYEVHKKFSEKTYYRMFRKNIVVIVDSN